MTQSWSCWYWRLGLTTSLIGGAIVFSKDCVLAQQITPDTTLGAESSRINSLTNQIEGGATRGANLFHSFEKFSVPTNGKVHFNNDLGIQNIISRVTGLSASSIDGLIKANGTANLFLLNPNGIIFGRNASLNIGGSFVASTASGLNFDDGTQFSAIPPQTPPLLTTSVPIGLQFGATPGRILNQSQASLDGAKNSLGFPAGLQVKTGRTLALIGGDVELEGGNLTAKGGRIELGSVASNSLVSLNLTEEVLTVSYEGVQNFQNIRLTPRTVNEFETPSFSFVDTTGDDSGAIQVQGRQVTLTGGSQILTTTLGSEQGGDLTVNASESVELVGVSPGIPPEFAFPSSFLSSTADAGDAGDIIITTGKLIVRDRAIISAASTGKLSPDDGQFIRATGSGGNLKVIATDSAELINGGILSTLTLGAGDAGDLTITTGRLTVQDGAEVAVSSQGTGDAGNLGVGARFVFLDNQGKLSATSESGKGGGNITLQDLNLLLLNDKSEISTSARGAGDGGNITINTDLLVGLKNSDITANAVKGRGGNVRITTQGIFGIQPRERPTPESDITASSELGIDGVVDINTPDVDPDEEAVNLPEEVVDVSGLVAQTCPARGGTVARGSSEFVITGRGGLPANPREVVRGETALVDLGTPIVSSTEQPSTSKRLSPVTSSRTPEEPLRRVEGHTEKQANSAVSTHLTNAASAPITEAQGWVVNPNGEVVLTAQDPTVTPKRSGPTSTACYGS